MSKRHCDCFLSHKFIVPFAFKRDHSLLILLGKNVGAPKAAGHQGYWVCSGIPTPPSHSIKRMHPNIRLARQSIGPPLTTPSTFFLYDLLFRDYIC
ncbi:unnamed protein product [Peniophora sp. CBMAI 1063]|nr:unnamed protein product [Peniophora sp. CBMAI 1063]